MTVRAQSSVSGVVTDENGKALFGVSVVEKGTSKGTQTDAEGSYTISADQGSVLVFSYVGYEKKEVRVTENRLDVNLKPDDVSLSEVIVVGSRNRERTIADSPVPVDVIDVQTINKVSPQINLNQLLNIVAPSFNSSTQTNADGTDHIDPASLRGLGPDQVLVLINGKRRHTSSLVNVNGTFGRGNVGTDLNAIPMAAIKRVEVLRDGAAAQYGSDAIAGVINIVLKTSTNKLTVQATAGTQASKNSNNQTGGFDGEKGNVNLNYGIPLGNKGGYINFTGDFDYRSDFNRMKEYENQIFSAYNAVEWSAHKDGYDINGLFTDFENIKKYAGKVDYFDHEKKEKIALSSKIEDLQEYLKKDVTNDELKRRGLERSDFNMRIGQSALRSGRFFMNFSLPVDDNGTELYAFGGMSTRRGNAGAFYRLPFQARTYTPMYINGFLPEIDAKIKDQSLAVGIRGNLKGWNADFSNVYGKNSFLYERPNSSNASMLNKSPRYFDAGGFAFTQNTTAFDLSRNFHNVFKSMNIAFGVVHRFEQYEIIAGEESSYAKYDKDGFVIKNPDTQHAPKDFFGHERPAGSQGLSGFSKDNALSRERSNIGLYFDTEVDFTDKFLTSFATRFENYSDFGSTINFKIASRYKLFKNLNLRVAANTGFRAPSLHQLYYNTTSTFFENGKIKIKGIFPNDSRAAKALGIPKLKQEESKSVSLGITTKIPSLNLKITADAFFVNIANRVVYTGTFGNKNKNKEMERALIQANAKQAAFFTNAIDTDTKGIEFVLSHKLPLGRNSLLGTELSGTFVKTERVGDIHASELLKKAELTNTYFDEMSRIYLERTLPRSKVVLNNNLKIDKINMLIRNVYFGETQEATNEKPQQQVFSPKIVTDLSISYMLTKALTMTVGSNNIFDTYPDRYVLGDTDPIKEGIQTNRSGGRFDFPRRSPQVGIGGRYVFARLSFNF
ncbi:TonB-dependent receptor [Elysia marginata]|uniref:TonB-dependent receptor n=1 Tax=Elysia marginata TaxID=1093978 RepID=A0AAV4FUX7_9GAST|nr:TonB-dependent receptor [Elysia marginata]